MKKRIIQTSLICCVLIGVALIILSQVVDKMGTKLIVFGDSIGAGVTHTASGESINEENQGYAKKLYHKLQGTTKYNKLSLVNHSISGYNSQDILRLLDNEDVKVSLKDAALIIINIGGNNYTGVLDDVTQTVKKFETMQNNPSLQMDFINNICTSLDEGLKTFQQDWPQIIKKIRAQNEKAPIYALTQYNPFVEASSAEKQIGTLADSYINRLNTVINDETLIKQCKYEVVNIYDIYEKAARKTDFVQLRLTDQYPDVHPTDIGHEAIATAVFDAVMSSDTK